MPKRGRWTRWRGWVSLLVTLAACSTPYQRQGLHIPRGGYAESRIDANTYYVEFKGNGYTPRQTVETFLLYRCAELTTEAGYDYFVLLGTDTEAKQFSYTTPGTYQATTVGSATAFGNMASGSATTTGTYTPGLTIPISKYGATATIKLFKGNKPADNPAAFNANEVLHYLGPAVGQSPPARSASIRPGVQSPLAPEAVSTPASPPLPAPSPTSPSSPSSRKRLEGGYQYELK